MCFRLNIFAGVTEAQTLKRRLKRGRGRRTHLRETEARLHMASAPIKQKANIKYGATLRFSYKPSIKKIKGEVNFIAGYTFKKEQCKSLYW